MLLIEIDGTNPDQVEADLIATGELCEQNGAIEVYVAEDREHDGADLERAAQHRRSVQSV